MDEFDMYRAAIVAAFAFFEFLLLQYRQAEKSFWVKHAPPKKCLCSSYIFAYICMLHTAAAVAASDEHFPIG